MENGIQILVIGKAGTGKTIISQEITDALIKLGFDVKWEISEDYKSQDDARKTGMHRLKAIEETSEKTSIIIKEIQARKDFNASLNYRVSDYNIED